MTKQTLLVILGLVALMLVGACSSGGNAGRRDGDDDDGGAGGDSDADGDGDSDADGDGDSDADGDTEVDIEEGNIFPSPMPPGDLSPANAPQIIVFGFDDCMFTGDHYNDTAQASDNGMNFISQMFGSMTNPDGSGAHVSFYVNGCYMPNSEEGGPWGSETDLTTAAYNEWLALGFELGNHTFDHLEINSTWGRIHEDWDDGSLGGWTDHVGTLMPEEVWLDPVIGFNHDFLVNALPVSDLKGMRAPRLEINGAGLRASKTQGYTYDCNLEEGHQWEYVSAAVEPGQDEAGFDWTVWPYALDNGSPGVWQSQDFGEKHYVDNTPTGLFEIPVYMLYIPDDGMQETIADRMKLEITSEDTSWIGDKVREISSYDFNGFIYARLTGDEFVEVMKYNFLLRYNGNRAPMTFGAHPAEFSWRYDNEVILGQPGNADYVDVLSYNTYADRKAAVTEFVDWVKANYGDDVYFMSNEELVEYMKNPFDKDGNPVQADALATPANGSLFSMADTWEVAKDDLGSDASYEITGPGSMEIEFTVGTNDETGGDYCWVDLSTYFDTGALAGVSHIDIEYEAEAPFRIRLLPDEGESALPMQALLAGVGGVRTARIRIKDFRPDVYASPTAINAAGHVDDAYMGDIAGIAFENAAPMDQLTYTVKINKIVFHGLDEL